MPKKMSSVAAWSRPTAMAPHERSVDRRLVACLKRAMLYVGVPPMPLTSCSVRGGLHVPKEDKRYGCLNFVVNTTDATSFLHLLPMFSIRLLQFLTGTTTDIYSKRGKAGYDVLLTFQAAGSQDLPNTQQHLQTVYQTGQLYIRSTKKSLRVYHSKRTRDKTRKFQVASKCHSQERR